MKVPNWLVKGTLVWFAFCVGQVVDIAVSETRIMVLVESPKGTWRNHPAEWLEYHDGEIRPTNLEETVKDIEKYRAYVAQMSDTLVKMEQQWVDQLL